MTRALAFLAAFILASCAMPVRDTTEIPPDARQGKEVRQICFTDQIRSWRPHDSKSVIVVKGLREEYKLELIGTCNPEDAFTSIGLISRVGGGLCLSPGDNLVTDARYNDGTCAIRRIYEWREDAATPPGN